MRSLRNIVIAVVSAFGLAVLIVWLLGSHGIFWHWVEVHTGTVNESGPYYGFWSGFGSDLGEITLITAILTPGILAARHHNCATRGCWRLTGHTLEDPDTHVKYRYCHKHHPLIPNEHEHHGIFRNHMSDEHTADLHRRLVEASTKSDTSDS